jgi:hypothetical protein
MADVHVAPMPARVRQIPCRWRPTHPPIFQNSDPTREDVLLALELVGALDAESFTWYGGEAATRRLKAYLDET